jgi:hypothetical protein
MILNSPYISGSLTVTGNATIQGSISGTITGSATSASLAQTASSIANLNQNVQITGSLTTNGTITAQTLVVQTITSSIVYSSGSNIFGNQLTDIQQMTGSLRVTGSFNVNNNILFVSSSGFIGMNTTQSFNSTLTVAPLKTPGVALQVIADKDGRTTSFYTSDYVNLTTGSTLRMGFSTGSGNTSASIQVYNTGENTYGSLLLNGGGGNVGINTSSPDFPLTVQTNTAAQSLKILSRGSGDSKVSWYSADNVLQYAHIDIGTTYFQVYASNNQPIQFYTSGSGGLSLTLNADKSATFSSSVSASGFTSTGAISIIPSTFNVGSATAADSNALTLQAANSNYLLRFRNAAGSTVGGLYYNGSNLIADTNNWIFGSFITVQANGSTFGTASTSGRAITIQASSGDGAILFKNLSGGDGTLSITGTSTSVNYYFSTYSVGGAFVINNNGNVAVAGALSKGSGSFRIKHPLASKKNTHQLVHSFIEGPQADLLYSGEIALVDGKAIINIDEAATMTEGTFEALNRNIRVFTSNETGWDNVRGKVTGNILTIESQNTESTDKISWLVIGERQDEHMMDTDWTDSNGKVIVEPLILEENK